VWSYTFTPPVRFHDVVLSQNTGTICLSHMLALEVYYCFVYWNHLEATGLVGLDANPNHDSYVSQYCNT